MQATVNDCRRYLSEAAYEHVPDALTVLRLLQHRQSPMVDTDWQTFGLPGQVPQWQVEFVNLIVRAHRRTGSTARYRRLARAHWPATSSLI
jgi:hypothetical protein